MDIVGQYAWITRIYFSTQYRAPAYIAGIVAAMIIHAKQNSFASSAGTLKTNSVENHCAAWMRFVVASVVFFAACFTGGGDAAGVSYIFYALPFAQPLNATWFRLLWALQRPFLSVSAAYFLVQTLSGQAPLMARILGAKIWRPVAALSYSCYLMQFLAMWPVAALSNAEKALVDAPVWLAVTFLLLSPVLVFLTVLPLGFLLYTFVERPGIFLGKHVESSTSKVEDRSRAVFKKVVQEGEAVRTPAASSEFAMPQYIPQHDTMSNTEVV